MITKRQKQVLDFIEKYTTKNQFAPSLKEIKEHFKLSSESTVHQHIESLISKGYIQKFKNQPRGVSVSSERTFTRIPLLGNISAGQPIEALSNKETIAVSHEQIIGPGNFYALRVVGDSMIEEGISDGDLVLVKQQDYANDGEKVVVLIDNENTTLKKIFREKEHIRLQPANRDFEPIFIKKDQDLKIQGIVIGIVKDNTEMEDAIKIPEQVIKSKVFTKIPENSIIHGETINVLRGFPDNSVDLVLADPPYNLSKGSDINFDRGELKGFGGKWNKVMEDWDNLPLADYMDFTFQWLKEVQRVLKPTGSIWVFGTYHNIGLINTIFQMLEIEIINEVIWYKRNAFPNLAGRRLTASHETILWAHTGKGKRDYYFDYKKSKDFADVSDLLKEGGKQMRTVWDIPNNKTKEELMHGKHPTQKPLRVCKRIIDLSTKPGDVVLSPFSGAGSECVAAKELGRNYIGIELEKEYVDISEKRLKATSQMKTLFN